MAKKNKNQKSKLFKLIDTFHVIEHTPHVGDALEYVIKRFDTEEGILVRLITSNSDAWSEDYRNVVEIEILITEDEYIWLKGNSKKDDASTIYQKHLILTFLQGTEGIPNLFSILKVKKIYSATNSK